VLAAAGIQRQAALLSPWSCNLYTKPAAKANPPAQAGFQPQRVGKA